MVKPPLPPYKRKADLRGERETVQYLCNIHLHMVSRLFPLHDLIVFEYDQMGSEVCLPNDTFWFVTSFDEDGDTCHCIYDVHEAIRIGLTVLEEKQKREEAAQRRRSHFTLITEE